MEGAPGASWSSYAPPIPPQSPPAQPPTFRPFGALTPWLVALSGLYLVTTIANHLVMGSGDPILTGTVGIVSFPVSVGLVAVGAIWFYRAGENADRLGAAGRTWPSFWGALSWFIPVANVILPYLYTREVWKASDPQAGPTDWRTADVPPFLDVWWVCWGGFQALSILVGVGGFIIGFQQAFRSAATGAAPLTSLPVWLEVLRWVQLGLLVVAYPLFVKVLYALEARQRDRGQRLMALQQKAAAPPPTGTF